MYYYFVHCVSYATEHPDLYHVKNAPAQLTYPKIESENILFPPYTSMLEAVSKAITVYESLPEAEVKKTSVFVYAVDLETEELTEFIKNTDYRDDINVRFIWFSDYRKWNVYCDRTDETGKKQTDLNVGKPVYAHDDKEAVKLTVERLKKDLSVDEGYQANADEANRIVYDVIQNKENGSQDKATRYLDNFNAAEFIGGCIYVPIKAFSH